MNNTTIHRHFFPSAWLLALGLTVAPAGVHAQAQQTGGADTLQVQVNIPPTWRPMLEDRVTDPFVSYIADVFHRRGYRGDIKQVHWAEEPSPDAALLTINLTEWRMNHIGNIDCTFTANLQTDDTTRHLGVFTGLAFRWMSGPGRFGLAEAFADAAEDAIQQLYRSLAETELVPGLRKRT